MTRVPAHPFPESVADAVRRLLGFDGRFPADPELALSQRERALLELVGGQRAEPGPPPDAGAWVVYVEPLGRVRLGAEGRECGTAVAWTSRRGEHQAVLDALPAPAGEDAMERLLSACSPAGLQDLVAAAIDSVDHTDPVMVYVEDETFSKVEPFNNLLARSGTPRPEHQLTALLELPLEAWTLGQRRLIYCMHLLDLARLRAEEFNGRQLTPASLRDFFEGKRRQYVGLLGGLDGAWPEELVDQAIALGGLKLRLSRTHTVYRWVNGVTFRKEERWRPTEDWSELPLPQALLHEAARYGLEGQEDLCHRIVHAICRLEDPQVRSERYAQLLEAAVRSAMSAVPSHVGMSRGMRDLGHFHDALAEGRLDEICAAPMADGFCAVFARDVWPKTWGAQPAAKVLTAISRRMQFNHWHYLPGHFPELVERRHFYYPPGMSDLAEHCDLQHHGHAFAKVRHAIRSSAPLTVAGRKLTGMVDIRLMRATGHPYTPAELRLVDQHTELVRRIAQALVDLHAQGLDTPVLRGFDRSDYEARYPAPLPAEVAQESSSDTLPRLGDSLRRAMVEHGSAAALICGRSQRRWSLSEVASLAARLAQELPSGSRVAALCEDRALQAVLLTAGLAAGLAVCPLDPRLAGPAKASLLEHLGPDRVLADPEVEALLAGPSLSPPERRGASLIVYTSGVTGRPKGVELSEEQLEANVAFAAGHFGYGPDWMSGCVLPLHHTFGPVSDLLPVLCVGGQAVVLPAFEAADAGLLAAALARSPIQSFSAVPLLLDALMAMGVRLPDTLRFVISGAAPLSERTRGRYLERFGHPVVSCYGLTESVCFATASPLEEHRTGSVGLPAGVEVCILGGDLQPVHAHVIGEVALRGPSVVQGYFQMDGDPEEVFLDEGWFLTGDLGCLDEQGFLSITGRRKNMVIRGGEKLYLEDLEDCLLEHPAVKEVCCVPAEGFFGFERVAAVLVGQGQDLDPSLRAHVQARLGPIARPDRLVWVDRIPRSAAGKPLRELLRRAVL